MGGDYGQPQSTVVGPQMTAVDDCEVLCMAIKASCRCRKT
jgi:hypothetical protein